MGGFLTLHEFLLSVCFKKDSQDGKHRLKSLAVSSDADPPDYPVLKDRTDAFHYRRMHLPLLPFNLPLESTIFCAVSQSFFAKLHRQPADGMFAALPLFLNTKNMADV
ncbi:MAG: hypothetical protein II456_07065 [Firmicutes bacterium]|nr:hypothetical protein [Bacillota bacterium]